MDWSPVLISMKTASLSIFITFFLGIFAAGVVIRLKNETSKIICAFEQVDPDLTAAARTLGMSEWEIFWKVLFANATPGILSGGVLAFARGLGEFGATSMIAGNIAGKTRTLPMAVYSEVSAGNMGAADRYVAVIVVIAFISILLMNLGALRAGGRKHGA